MKKYIFVAIVFFYLIGFSGCSAHEPDCKIIIEMDTEIQKMLIGKWEIFAKNNKNIDTSFGNPVEPGMFITFYQDGSFTSNIGQKSGYYIITFGSWLYFYSNRPYKDFTHFYDAAFIYGVKDNESGGFFANKITDTLSLQPCYNCGVFFNDTNTSWFHFNRLEE